MAATRPAPGDTFSSTVTFTPEEVAAFARMAGDHNPLHHDPAHAARSRYGRLIASGPHTTAILMALTATYFSARGGVVGLEFNFRFQKPVFADETVTLEWVVDSVTPDPTLKGDIIEMTGRIRNNAGETALKARGRALMADRL